jgi:hypothetical protein
VGRKVDGTEEGAGGLGLGNTFTGICGGRVLFEAGTVGLLWMSVKPQAFMLDGCDGVRFISEDMTDVPSAL